MAKKLPNIHPGEVLREEFLKPMGISQNAMARAIGVPPRRINEIVLGKRRITADTALRLARAFSTSEQFWMGLQADYDRKKPGRPPIGLFEKYAPSPPEKRHRPKHRRIRRCLGQEQRGQHTPSEGPQRGSDQRNLFHQMDVVGGDDVIQHAQPVPLRGLEEPLPPAPAVARELQEEVALMTPVGDMPDVMGEKIAMGPRHGASSVKHDLGPKTCALRPLAASF